MKNLRVFAFSLVFSLFCFTAVTPALCQVTAIVPMFGGDLTGPRAMGMAGAFTGIADDASAYYWNPAGLAFMGRYNIGTELYVFPGTYWSSRITYNYPGAAVTAMRSSQGMDFTGTNFGVYDAFIFSQSIPIHEVFSLGLNLKGISADTGTIPGFGIDAAAMLKTEYLRLGFTVQDIYTRIANTAFTYPRKFKIGAGIGPFSNVMIGFQVDMNAIDAGIPFIGNTAAYIVSTIRMGAEYWLLDKKLGLRTGYYVSPANLMNSKITQGMGLGLSVKLEYFSLDYAFNLPFEEVRVTQGSHFTGMTFMWGKTKEQLAAEKEETMDSDKKSKMAEELLKLASFSETLSKKAEETEEWKKRAYAYARMIKKMQADSATMAAELEKARSDSMAMQAQGGERARELEEKLNMMREYAVVDPLLKNEIATNIASEVVIKQTQEGLDLNFRRDFFFKGRALEAAAYRSLDVVVVAFKKYPGHLIMVNGYTDSTGSRKLNISISNDCAKAMMNYLISRGIPAESITGNGYGPDRPTAPNDTKDGRAKNRRVEMIIYKP